MLEMFAEDYFVFGVLIHTAHYGGITYYVPVLYKFIIFLLTFLLIC